MKIYKLEYEQHLPVSKEECWNFFSNPVNLEKITPPDMNFEIKSELPDAVYAGQIIEYKIKLFPGVKASWVTEITQVDEGNYFIDEQRFGPYKFWHHQHHFIPTKDGILARDIVHYGLPFGFLGRIAQRLFIRRKLKFIFDYRKKVIDELFD
ncbi:hypothetical protein ACFLTH_12915 [Bacteroidota bacterium]